MNKTHSKLLQRIDFGNEAGDDIQPSEIVNFFVEQSSFHKYLNPTKNILLTTAKKGVGKSALIRWIEAKVQEEYTDNILVISCKGSDLVRSNFKLLSDLKNPNDYIQDWKIRICALINRRLGAKINLALDDDSITLVESAELDGFKSRNIVSALSDRMKKLIPKATSEKQHASNEVELLKRFNYKQVWFLVDDLDATYQRTDRENMELSTFFSACRYLCTEVSGIKFRLTMRTDVWTMIRRYDESLDKFEQYVHDITWSQADFRTLLSKRIKYQIDELNIKIPNLSTTISNKNEEIYINQIFEKDTYWGESRKPKPTYQIIYTLSYSRPRWAIQLCKLAQEVAIEKGNKLIVREHIDLIWGEYGKKRIADLIAEHKHQCRDVEELINAFRGAERHMSRDDLMMWINKHIMNHMLPVIEGKKVNSAQTVAHFLYRLGFIGARVANEHGGYEHYYFADMPDFLSSRTNQDFNAVWEIHPCYREALDIQKLNRYQKKRRNHAR